MRPYLAAVAAVLALAVLAAPASAQRCQAPPGTAAIDQYCETVPTARGDRSSVDPRGPAAAAAPPPVAPRTASVLAAAGDDGAALTRALSAAPSPPGKDRRARPKAPRAKGSVPQAPSGDPLAAVGPALGSGDVVGGGLAWALLASTVALLGWAWVGARRRRGS